MHCYYTTEFLNETMDLEIRGGLVALFRGLKTGQHKALILTLLKKPGIGVKTGCGGKI